MADLKDLFGVGFNPLMGMMDPNMQKQFTDQQNFDTVLGLLSGYSNSLYQGRSPTQKLFNTLVGGYQGRLGTVSRFSDLMKAQTGIAKDRADLFKTQLESKQLGNKLQAVDDYVRNSTDPFLKRAYRINPEGVTSALMDTKFAKMPKLSGDDFFLARSMGYDLNNLTQEQARNLMAIREGQTSREQIQSQVDKFNIAKDYEGLVDNVISDPQTKTQIMNNLINQSNNQSNIQPDQFGTYMPGLNINIPSTDLFSNKPSFTYQDPAKFVGGNFAQQGNQQGTQTVVPQGNQQGTQQGTPRVNQTEKYNNYQTFQNKLMNLDKRFESETGIVPIDYKYTPSQIKKYADNREDFTLKSIQTIDDFNQSLMTIDEILNHSAFEKFFSAGGMVQGVASRDGIELKNLYNNLVSSGTADNLVRMKLEDKNGATPFGQLNYSELKLVRDAFSKLSESGGTPEAARRALTELRNDIMRSRGYILEKHNAIYDGYKMDKFANSYSAGMETPDNMPIFLGRVAKGKFFGQYENLDDDVYYVQKPNGAFVAVPNKKKGGKLTKKDYLKGNY